MFGSVVSRKYSGVVKAWAMNPSATSARDPGHRRAHPGEDDLRAPGRARLGVEHRGHERVAVEVAPELEGRPLVPAVPDGVDRRDQLAHAGRGLRPRHREALGDVGLDLGAEPEDEPAARLLVEVVADVRQQHRVAGEGDRDRRHQLDPLGVVGGDRERQERVVGDLGADRPVEAELLEPAGGLADSVERAREAAVDPHSSSCSRRKRWSSSASSSPVGRSARLRMASSCPSRVRRASSRASAVADQGVEAGRQRIACVPQVGDDRRVEAIRSRPRAGRRCRPGRPRSRRSGEPAPTARARGCRPSGTGPLDRGRGHRRARRAAR